LASLRIQTITYKLATKVDSGFRKQVCTISIDRESPTNEN
jgi:hypothetical protein